MSKTYFKVKMSSMPKGDWIQCGSCNKKKSECIASSSNPKEIKALEAVGTRLTKQEAQSQRRAWDLLFPSFK